MVGMVGLTIIHGEMCFPSPDDREKAPRIDQQLQRCSGSDVYMSIGGSLMKVWKIAALVALAAIPVLLITTNSKKKDGIRPIAGDSDNIFESELTVE
jgi:hypothetical protein